MVVVVLQSVGPWLGKWGCGWFVGVHHPKLRSFGVFACGDREFLLFWDIFKRCYTRLAAAFARSLPFISVCPLILCSDVGRPRLILTLDCGVGFL